MAFLKAICFFLIFNEIRIFNMVVANALELPFQHVVVGSQNSIHIFVNLNLV